VKFSVVAHTATGDRRLKFLFQDKNGDSTLSHIHGGGSFEEIQVLTGADSLPPNKLKVTWTIRLKGDTDSTLTPSVGDVYTLALQRPFTVGDVFTFTTTGKSISVDKAKEEFAKGPYVVPNPYVGAASFEPSPFGVQGRGDRRIEFRNLPRECTIRIFTLHGDLVQTLRHEGTDDGYLSWNLRTKDNLDVAPGLFIYQVDAGGTYGTHIGKFAIIK
jgi:hypothetical protein